MRIESGRQASAWPAPALTEQFEQSPLAVIAWDASFRVSLWSPRASELFGWTSDEVFGRRPTEWPFILEEDRQRLETMFERLKSREWLSRIEHVRLLNREGQVLNCAWYNALQVDSSGQTQGMVSLIYDETESRRAEEQRKRQNELLEFALSSARMGCWEWDLKTDAVIFYGPLEPMFGFPVHRFPGTMRAVVERMHPEDVAKVRADVAEAIRLRRDYGHDFRVLMPSGEVRWLHSSGRPVFDQEGRAVRILGTSQDSTERRRGEDNLRAAKDSAETSSALKSAFLANMSHEIRTPLGVILGFVELLSDSELKPEERTEYTDVIARNGAHLSRLIDDILDLSKVEAGKLEIHPCPFSLREGLGDLLRHFEGKARAKGVELHVVVREGVPATILTDPVRFKQVVSNLLGNAMKFTERGEIRLEISRVEGPAGGLAVRVIDTGIGISPDGQRQLFEPFIQADRSLTRRFGGTGLGLALSRKLGRALGGDIRLLTSSPAAGSTFEFILPADVIPPSPVDEQVGGAFCLRAGMSETGLSERTRAPAPMPPETNGLHGLRILLAEDSRDNQVLMERLLSRRGARLEIASDGLEAIERAERGEHDVILMDIQMPRLNGYEATRALRARGYKGPIIALTAHAMKEERERCLAAGCDDHLSKPVSARELVAIIARLTGAKPRPPECTL